MFYRDLWAPPWTSLESHCSECAVNASSALAETSDLSVLLFSALAARIDFNII